MRSEEEKEKRRELIGRDESRRPGAMPRRDVVQHETKRVVEKTDEKLRMDQREHDS